MAWMDKFDVTLLPYLDQLDEEELNIIQHFYGLNGKPKLNLPAIAEMLRNPGVSTTHVRGIVATCLMTLRRARDVEANKGPSVREGDSVA